MSREMEDRLRAAFESKTAQVTASSLRPADPPDHDDRPSDGIVIPLGGRRHRWIAPLLAAAAVIAVAVGATAAVTVGAEGHHRTPANTPTPSTSVPSPTPSSKTSSHHPAAPPPSMGGGSSGSTNSSPAGPPEPTHTITVQGVTLQVPKNWTVTSSGTHHPFTSCISADQSTKCQLEVMVVTATQAQDNGFKYDKPEVIGDGNMCGSAGAAADAVKTVQATNVPIDGQQAEYRSYTGGCESGTYEQWVVPTAPGVIFTRHDVGPDTDAAALYAVTHAVLPGPRSPLRLDDVGVIRSVTPVAGGVRIDLDRVTMLEQGGTTNTNTATYSYVLASNLQIGSPTSADLKPLTVQDLVQLASGKSVHGISPPLSSLLAQLWTDGNRVNHMLLDVR
jgi:hypothetical protein